MNWQWLGSQSIKIHSELFCDPWVRNKFPTGLQRVSLLGFSGVRKFISCSLVLVPCTGWCSALFLRHCLWKLETTLNSLRCGEKICGYSCQWVSLSCNSMLSCAARRDMKRGSEQNLPVFHSFEIWSFYRAEKRAGRCHSRCFTDVKATLNLKWVFFFPTSWWHKCMV